MDRCGTEQRCCSCQIEEAEAELSRIGMKPLPRVKADSVSCDGCRADPHPRLIDNLIHSDPGRKMAVYVQKQMKIIRH